MYENLLVPKEGESSVCLVTQDARVSSPQMSYAGVLRLQVPVAGLYKISVVAAVGPIGSLCPITLIDVNGIDDCATPSWSYKALERKTHPPSTLGLINFVEGVWLRDSAVIFLGVAQGSVSNAFIRAARLEERERKMIHTLLLRMSPAERRRLLAEFKDLRKDL